MSTARRTSAPDRRDASARDAVLDFAVGDRTRVAVLIGAGFGRRAHARTIGPRSIGARVGTDEPDAGPYRAASA